MKCGVQNTIAEKRTERGPEQVSVCFQLEFKIYYIHSPKHFLNKYILNTHCIPGTI